MSPLFAAVALAGAAAAASAQTAGTATYTIHFGSPSGPNAISLPLGASISVFVNVGFLPGPGQNVTFGPVSGPVLGLSGGGFSITGAGFCGAWSNNTLVPPYDYPSGTSAGTNAGLSVSGVIWDYGPLTPPHISAKDPDTVWSGTFTALGGPVNLSTTGLTHTGVFFGTPSPSVAPYDSVGAGASIFNQFFLGCYPDCDSSGALTIADFGCFQSKFATGAPYADCNQNCTLTIADFTCFQGKFVQGCP